MKLLHLFETQLQEINMSPSSLKAFAQTPQAQQVLVGFETEMIVPVSDDYDPMAERNYDEDTSADDIDEVIEFFRGGQNPISRAEASALRRYLSDAYQEWQDDQVRNAMDSVADRKIKAMALRDNMDSSEIEKMLDARDDLYHEYYNQVFERVEQEFQENTSFYNYAQDVGMRLMSDVASEHNLEWPYWTEPADSKQLMIQEVAKDIQSDLDIQVFVSTEYHTAPRTQQAWVLEPDSSIQTEESDTVGLELITPSPPFPLPEALTWIDRVFDWAQSYGCATNSTTGFHMSVSMPGIDMNQVDWIKLVIMLGDKYVLDVFGRTANTYTASAMDMFTKHLALDKDINVVSVMDSMKKGLMDLASKQVGRPHTTKYVSVNVKNNYIEFRSAGGNYFENRELIKNTMIRYARAFVLAADPQAEKKEYASKLYKLVSQSVQGTGASHVMELFSLYNSGSIKKSVLINSIRRYREDLQAKKS